MLTPVPSRVTPANIIAIRYSGKTARSKSRVERPEDRPGRNRLRMTAKVSMTDPEGEPVKKILFLSLLIVAAHPRPGAANEDFSMRIMDVFAITGRGTIMTGKIATGVLNSGDTVCIPLVSGDMTARPVKGIEQFRKILEHAEAGQMVGVLVEGIDRKDIAKGENLHADCGAASEP
jgi:translation elongation factor EF-Tu-like GTPase